MQKKWQKKINLAYDILGNKDKRAKYDEKLKNERYNTYTINKNNNINSDSINNNNSTDKKDYINITKNTTTLSSKNYIFFIVIIIFIIISALILFSSIFKPNNHYLSKNIETKYNNIQTVGKVNKVIECSLYGHIYQINNEYWYCPFGSKIESNVTILSDSNGNYILKENQQLVYKIEKIYQSNINGTFEGFTNKTGPYLDRSNKGSFTLENGDIWAQNDPLSYSQILENPKVTLYFIDTVNTYNGYYLCVDDINKAVKVNYLNNKFNYKY